MTSGASDELPPQAYAASLAGFRSMNVHRLGALLRGRTPTDAWAVVRGERPADGLVGRVLADPGLRAAWRRSVEERPPEQVWQRCLELGVRVLVHGDDGYPAVLLDDPLPPPVLFVAGNADLLAGRRVAIVGTRNATATGRTMARALGHDLATAGVHVVSGLARGVDGAAHLGVLSAEGEGRAIGIVASGHDVVYPREHRDLWSAVIDSGLLIAESPPGTAPEAFRFPLRNRIVAALSEVVVVVESRERGGSLLTAADAIDRNVPVMAVPGPVDRRAASGVNQLLCDGATPVTGADDVLAFLSFQHQRAVATAADLRPRPRGGDLAAYRVVRDDPRTVDGVALALGASLVEAAMRLARLEADGWIAQADGWFECVGTPLT